jgi:hypothetical protein
MRFMQLDAYCVCHDVPLIANDVQTSSCALYVLIYLLLPSYSVNFSVTCVSDFLETGHMFVTEYQLRQIRH